MIRRARPTPSPYSAQLSTTAVPRPFSARALTTPWPFIAKTSPPSSSPWAAAAVPHDSEGGVGHDYLLAHGVSENQIIAETQSTNTEESAARLAAIARENHLIRILAVSDGTHLFRIHTLCTSMGLQVVTSPRIEARRLAPWDAAARLMHEMLSYTLWRLTTH